MLDTRIRHGRLVIGSWRLNVKQSGVDRMLTYTVAQR
jgi:hypothetical protein